MQPRIIQRAMQNGEIYFTATYATIPSRKLLGSRVAFNAKVAASFDDIALRELYAKLAIRTIADAGLEFVFCPSEVVTFAGKAGAL